MMQEHPCFSSKYMELIDLLLGLKPPTAIESLRSRFACFHMLMVHIVKVRIFNYGIISFLIYNVSISVGLRYEIAFSIRDLSFL